MIWYVVLMPVLAVLTVYCLISTLRSGKKIAPYVSRCLLWLLIPIIANLLIALTDNITICRFCFTVYFLSSTILLFYFAEFSIEYCGFKLKRSLLRRILASFAIADSVSVALNYVFGHVFELEVRALPDADSGVYVAFVSLWYHKVHLAISALFVLVIIAVFIIKIVNTSKLYRDRFNAILEVFVITSAWEAYHIVQNEVVDQSIIGFVACGIFLYLYSVRYVPSVLLDEMKRTVLGTISDGILFFDEGRNCIYANDAARLMLGMGLKETASGFDKLLALTGEDRDQSAIYDSKSMTCSKVENGEEYIYELEFHKLHDMQGKKIGSFAKIIDTTERTKRENMNKYLATHDKLTGIYNADRFFEEVRNVLKDNPDKDFVVVASDIKEFKLVNDRYGRQFADKLLIRIANLFNEKVTSPTTRYGRLGSDKFGCLIEKSLYSEQTFTDAIREVPNVGRNLVIPIILHAGVYVIEDKNMPVSAMFDRAFIAIQGIKNDAEKRIAYYEEGARDEMLWDQMVTEQLDNAIRTGQIVPYLQAQVSRQGKVVGAEVLVRWIHPEEGFMPPGKFLGILEKNGMIAKVDRFIWESACKILRRWSYEGRDDLYLSVNISPKDFYMMDVPKTIIGLADKYELDRGRLRLEITETIMMNDIDEKLKTIDTLREAGFIVEMDDFGSGYSSLNMLKDMPVDVLKLDMIFLKDTANNERTKKIMSLIIDLAKSLDVPVIAEGVETIEQVESLSSMGCDFFQGYYFSRPVSLSEYEQKNLSA